MALCGGKQFRKNCCSLLVFGKYNTYLSQRLFVFLVFSHTHTSAVLLGAGGGSVTISQFNVVNDGIFTTAGHTLSALDSIAMHANTNKKHKSFWF